MGHLVPTGIQDRDNLNPGQYHATVLKLEEAQHDDGRLFYNAQMRVVEPAEQRGRMHFERFWIGIKDDPQASTSKTWQESVGAKQLKRMCRAIGIPFEGENMDTVCQHVAGQAVGFQIVARVVDGNEYMNINKFMAPGSFVPELDVSYVPHGSVGQDTGSPPPSTPVIPAAMPAAVPQPASALPAAAMPQTGIAPVTTAPPTYAAPAPIATHPAGTAPATAAQPSEQLVKCVVCAQSGKDVSLPLSEFQTHVNEHYKGNELGHAPQ